MILPIRQFLIGLFLICFVVCAVGISKSEVLEDKESQTYLARSAIDKITRITIDGEADDWTDRPLLHTDPRSDSKPGAIDFTDCYAFSNNDALYLMIRMTSVEPECTLVQIELIVGAKRYTILCSPESDSGTVCDMTNDSINIGRTANSSFSFNSVFEGRIDKRDFSLNDKLILSYVSSLVMTDNNDIPFETADLWEPERIPEINENDPNWLISDELKYRLARRFKLPQGMVADIIFTPPVPGLTDIAKSHSGVIYLLQNEVPQLQNNLSHCVSVLNPSTGNVTKVYEFPEGGGSGSLVGGIGDTVLVPISSEYIGNKEYIEIGPDGTVSNWGTTDDGKILCVTPDGRAIGYSNDGSRILEFEKDGSSTEIANGFDNIYDIVSGSNGVFYISEFLTGNILKLNPDGSRTTLAEGVLTRDPLDLSIDPSGRLFLNTVTTGFVMVDSQTGAFTNFDILSPYADHLADFEFVDSGRVVFVDPTMSMVAWGDINTLETDLLVTNEGSNSSAIDIGPDGKLYVGTSGCGNLFQAQVFSLDNDGNIETYISGLCGTIDDISFNSDGGLFISMNIPNKGAELYYVDPVTKTPEKIPGIYERNSIVVDPKSGNLLITSPGRQAIQEISKNGLVKEYIIQFPKTVTNWKIDINFDGTVYAQAVELERVATGPEVDRWVFKLDLDEGTAESIFYNPHEGCCVMGNIDVDPQNTIWWLFSPWGGIYKITNDGDISFFLQNPPCDPRSVVSDGLGNVYFTSPEGIFRIYPDQDQIVPTNSNIITVPINLLLLRDENLIN